MAGAPWFGSKEWIGSVEDGIGLCLRLCLQCQV
jgi:hypothetical protein